MVVFPYGEANFCKVIFQQQASLRGSLVWFLKWRRLGHRQLKVCGQVIDTMKTNAIFLLDLGYPLFISEWGVDQKGTNENDHRYLNCFLGWAAEHDLDWALWSLVGSYYYREGVVGMEEFCGILNWNSHETRNSSFLKKISPLQSPFQAPFSA
ncbi:ricin B, lectin domain, Glycoside hydrolase, family 5 [Artemisia annua]|uniref:Ricin B, lectin domain, Glycoside hydrolase, family 5 n=1 Tax=Artemisia annua TaxID=35608 RepID=A0A2U1KWE6_ARTAN|nr:ricin B, lectin domain, Glycoside hydrolase, family 5 [Artemisia annua]